MKSINNDSRAEQIPSTDGNADLLVQHQQRLLLSGPTGQAQAEFVSLASLALPPADAVKH